MRIESIDFDGSLVGQGRLMSPSQIQEGFAERGQQVPGLLTGWCLCGATSTAMFEAIGRHGGAVDVRLTGFVGPANGTYAVLTQQLGSRQHRFLLPLYEPEVMDFLKSLERHSIQVMLGTGRSNQAVVLHNQLPWRLVQPLVGMSQPDHRVAPDDALEEMAGAICEMSRPTAIPSLYRGVELDDVSVSVIVPERYCRDAGQGIQTERV